MTADRVTRFLGGSFTKPKIVVPHRCFVGKAKLRAFISTNLSEQEVGEGEIAKWEE